MKQAQRPRQVHHPRDTEFRYGLAVVDKGRPDTKPDTKSETKPVAKTKSKSDEQPSNATKSDKGTLHTYPPTLTRFSLQMKPSYPRVVDAKPDVKSVMRIIASPVTATTNALNTNVKRKVETPKNAQGGG